MIKVYITVISSHTEKDFYKILYRPDGFDLPGNRPAYFPIIPIIADDFEKGDKAMVLALCPGTPDSQPNITLLKEELDDLGVGRDALTEILMGKTQGVNDGISLLLSILDAVPDDSVIRADITYGTKPTTAILLNALDCVEKVKDTEVEGIYYGELPRLHGEPLIDEAKLYDLTAYKILGDVIDDMKGMDVKDVSSALRQLLQ